MKNFPLVHVTSVEVLGGFQLRVSFDDGSSRDVDVEELLRGPVFEPLLKDPELFARVQVDHELGTVVWPNGADLDPVVLHGSAEPAWKDTNGSKGGQPIRPDQGRPETRGGTRKK